MKKPLVLIIVTFSVILGFVIFALVKNPPQEQEPHVHDDEQTEQEAAFLEQTFTAIDASVSKNLVLKVAEMNNRGPADAIANSLLQYEESIGGITADLNGKVFTIEYDSSKLKEEDLLRTVKATGYTIEKTSEETPAP